MHWVLFVNGEGTFSESIRETVRSADTIVAVDGGCRHLKKLEILPHLALGDMDSIPKVLLDELKAHDIPLYLHPAQKDATDLELALELAINQGATAVTILGATGGRLDHTLGNVFLLSKYRRHGFALCIKDGAQHIQIVEQTLKLRGNPGDVLSLIPLSPTVSGITLQGLQYPLCDATLIFGSTQGISNVFLDHDVVITVGAGLLLAIHQYGTPTHSQEQE